MQPSSETTEKQDYTVLAINTATEDAPSTHAREVEISSFSRLKKAMCPSSKYKRRKFYISLLAKSHYHISKGVFVFGICCLAYVLYY